MVLLCIYLCGLYANNLDIADSKGRSFWDKRFVVYDTNTSLIIKTCKNKEWFEEQGLQFDRESRSNNGLYPYGTHSFGNTRF